MNESQLIGTAFASSCFGLLTLQILVMDVFRFIKKLSDDFESDLGHDALIFPDYDPFP